MAREGRISDLHAWAFAGHSRRFSVGIRGAFAGIRGHSRVSCLYAAAIASMPKSCVHSCFAANYVFGARTESDTEKPKNLVELTLLYNFTASRSGSRLVGRSVGRSLGRLVGRWSGRSVVRSVGRSAGRSVVGLVGRWAGRSVARLPTTKEHRRPRIDQLLGMISIVFGKLFSRTGSRVSAGK